jgi:hypothetical protein
MRNGNGNSHGAKCDNPWRPPQESKKTDGSAVRAARVTAPPLSPPPDPRPTAIRRSPRSSSWPRMCPFAFMRTSGAKVPGQGVVAITRKNLCGSSLISPSGSEASIH